MYLFDVVFPLGSAESRKILQWLRALTLGPTALSLGFYSKSCIFTILANLFKCSKTQRILVYYS